MLINKPAGLLSLSAKIRATSTPCITGWLASAVPGKSLPTSRWHLRLDGDVRNKGINALLCQTVQPAHGISSLSALLCGHRWKTRDSGRWHVKDPAWFLAHGALRLPRQTGAFALSGVIDRLYQEGEGAGVNPVTLTPETGRTHQLRIHSPAAGLSGSLAASLYGGREPPGTGTGPRLMPHASELRFVQSAMARCISSRRARFLTFAAGKPVTTSDCRAP